MSSISILIIANAIVNIITSSIVSYVCYLGIKSAKKKNNINNAIKVQKVKK